MTHCKFCNSIDVKILSADPYGDDAVIQCLDCSEIFEQDKEEVEQDERHED